MTPHLLASEVLDKSEPAFRAQSRRPAWAPHMPWGPRALRPSLRAGHQRENTGWDARWVAPTFPLWEPQPRWRPPTRPFRWILESAFSCPGAWPEGTPTAPWGDLPTPCQWSQ